jgi:predicted DNA-binding transcriptional regulator AlpA
MQQTQAPTAEPLLDDTQTAQFFGVDERTVRTWRRTRGLPHLRLTSKVIRFRRSDLEKWAERRAVHVLA